MPLLEIVNFIGEGCRWIVESQIDKVSSVFSCLAGMTTAVAAIASKSKLLVKGHAQLSVLVRCHSL